MPRPQLSNRILQDSTLSIPSSADLHARRALPSGEHQNTYRRTGSETDSGLATRIPWILLSILGLIFLASSIDDTSRGAALTALTIGFAMLIAGGYKILRINRQNKESFYDRQLGPGAQTRRDALSGSSGDVPTAPYQVVQKETIIQREIVEVPCKYCGTLNVLATTKYCTSCGAPIT
jgi:hypothetical protein